MSEITAALRNRFNTTDKDSTEEILIEKLDIFLSSIESRLDQFEQYFKFNNIEDLDEELRNDGKHKLLEVNTPDAATASAIDDPIKISVTNNGNNAEDEYEIAMSEEEEEVEDSSRLQLPKSRRSSTSSVKSFRNFAKLDMIHQRLKFIKQSVLKSSILNLDYLYKTLDDQYNYLFNSDDLADQLDSKLDNSKEILSEKIITTMQYFDEKLTHIDSLIQRRIQPIETDESIFNIFKFYNFNKALKIAQHKHLHYYQLPLGWRENRYIINGYRFSLHHTTMLKSIFQFNHNESMNIWTHLIGIFIMLYYWFVDFPSTEVYKTNTFKDNAVVYFFLSCAISCLVSSSCWHTYSCFAKLNTRYNFACIDYTGITILITASIIAVEYVSLYNYPKLLNFFIPFTSICGTSGLLFSWTPYFDKPECRSIRISYFVGLAGLGAATIFLLCIYEGFIKSFKFFIPLFYKSLVWYWIGVIFYGGLIPERWRYDVVINEDEFCDHVHNTSDVISGNIEKSGREEYEEIEHDLTTQILRNRKPQKEQEEEQEDEDEEEEAENEKFKSIINKHFPEEPQKTHYEKDFFSLWWVDYVFSSHNIWHIFVVLGVMGHYYCVVDMYSKITPLPA